MSQTLESPRFSRPFPDRAFRSKRKLRVGFLSTKNYLDWQAFSGVLINMYGALMAHPEIEVVPLGNFREVSLQSRLQGYSERLSDRLGLSSQAQRDQALLDLLQQQLHSTPLDVVFVPVGKAEVAHLNFPVPVVSYTDATAKLLASSYLNFGDAEIFCDPETFEQEHQQELKAIRKSSRLILASDWAAQSAIADYAADPVRVAVVPMGANLLDIPTSQQVREYRHSPAAQSTAPPFRLLFIGRHWYRKGGPIALDALRSLLQRGIPAELSVMSMAPDDLEQDPLVGPHIRRIPLLNKNNPQQRQQYLAELWRAHMLISPTRADCAPMVVAEANALGLPCITTDVGGLPTIIQPGRNGFMLPLDATGVDFADQLAALRRQPDRYLALTHTARQHYEQTLNWECWANSMHQHLRAAWQETAVQPVSRQKLALVD
jgi:glycosyltransferase involved in cell wall biosynthesis